MSIFAKITAFFSFKGKNEQMALEAAEILSEGVVLHPTEAPEHSFFIKTTEVDSSQQRQRAC